MRRSLMSLFFAGAISSVFTGGGATVRAIPVASVVPLDVNLVRNPGAELGVTGDPDGYKLVPIKHWVRAGKFTLVPFGASGGFPTVAEGTRIHGGKYFFAGGADNTRSSASQLIDVSTRAAKIDAGRLRVQVSAFLAGYATQSDSAQVVVEFMNASGVVVGAVRTAPVSATSEKFVKKSAAALVPSGTRKLRVKLLAARGNGSYNDGYFDKLDLRIKLV